MSAFVSPALRSQAGVIRPGKSGAFTLLEILIASVGAALIFAAIYGVFSSGMHLREKAIVHTREAQMRARAYSTIRNDLRDAQVTGGVLGSILTTTQTSSQSQFPGYIQFTTSNAEVADGQVGGDIQEIEYYIIASANSPDHTSGTLVRTVTRNLLPTTQDNPPQQPLLDGVKSLEVNFYDGTTWQTSWTLADPNDTLPQAIRFHIERAPDGVGAGAMPIDIVVPWTTQQFIGTSSTSTTTGTGTSTGTGS